jgi:mono/diheme cytochrome c family protein
MKRRLFLVAAGLLGLFVLAQLVPYGRSHANPRPTRAARFDSPQTRALFAGACADCHTYDTKWKWYSNVAPASWLVQRDVDEGRSNLNLSTWDRPQPGVDEVVERVVDGSMPPLQYKVAHPASRLSKAERRRLAEGLRRTYAADPPASP